MNITPEDLKTVERALTNLIHEIAGEQHDRDEIAKAFCGPVADAVVNARHALTLLTRIPSEGSGEVVAWDVVNCDGRPVDTSTHRTREAAHKRADQCNEGLYTTGKPFSVTPLYAHPPDDREERMGEWIPCSERPYPPDRRAVLVYCPERRNVYACTMDIRSSAKWYIFGSGGDLLHEDVSHWMPIPTTPNNA